MDNLTAYRRLKQSSIRDYLMLSGLMLQVTVDLFDISMFNVALPSIQREYGLSIEVLSLVVGVRYIANVGLMPIYGLIGDRFGRKRIFVTGLAIFIVGAVASLLAPSLFWLVLGRTLIGIGSGILPLAMAIVADHYPQDQRGKYLGIWNSAAPAGAIIGPPLGGLIIEAFGWKAIFVIVVLGTAIALMLVQRHVAPTRQNIIPETRIDWIGAASLFGMVTGLLLATATRSVFPFGSSTNLSFWTMSALAISMLVWNARVNPHPLVDLSVLRNRQLITSSVGMVFRMFALTGSSFLLVLYLTNVYGKSPSAVGVFMVFQSLAIFLGGPLGGLMTDRWSSMKSARLGMLIQAAGMAWLSIVGPEGGSAIMIPGMVLSGFGGGICLAPFIESAVTSMGDQKAGRAAGLFNMVRFVGAASSTPLIGLILASGFEVFGGSNAVAEPYQTAFRILAISSLLGALVAASMPQSPPKKTADVFPGSQTLPLDSA